MKKKTAAQLALLAVALVGLAAPADDAEPYAVVLKVGEALDLCATRTILCPATNPICDDLSVATMRDGAKGLELVGVGPGKTLCSARSTNKQRRVYAVTIAAPMPAPAPAPGPAPAQRP